MGKNTKCVVIGLDGGTWNVITPLIKKGKLTTFEKLLSKGCWGSLISSIPSVTFPAWKCYSTGRNPGKIGIYWFIQVDTERKAIMINNSTTVKTKEIWDYLNQRGLTCGVIGMPGMYPPRKIDGFIVCEDAPNPRYFTYPKDLGSLLEKEIGYKLSPEGPKKYVEEIKEIIKQRFRAARLLGQIYNPSFLHLTIYHLDTIQHHFWKEMDSNDPDHGNVIEEIMVVIDKELEKLLNAIGDQTYLVMMSDHGFTASKSTFQLAKWLIDKKYLVLQKKWTISGFMGKILSKTPLEKEHLLRTLQKMKLSNILRQTIHIKMRSKVLHELFPIADEVEKNPLEGAIDWEKSRVIPIPQGLIYVNKRFFSSRKEARGFRNKLTREIENIKNPVNGEHLARRVYYPREIYSGKYVDKAPDIIVLPSRGYEIACSTGAEKLWNKPQKWTGVHKPEGIFIMHGPAVQQGLRINDISILDLTPTILHIFNMPLPQNLDGRVLMEVFRGQSDIAKREVVYQKVDERARVKEKIQELKKSDKI